LWAEHIARLLPDHGVPGGFRGSRLSQGCGSQLAARVQGVEGRGALDPKKGPGCTGRAGEGEGAVAAAAARVSGEGPTATGEGPPEGAGSAVGGGPARRMGDGDARGGGAQESSWREGGGHDRVPIRRR